MLCAPLALLLPLAAGCVTGSGGGDRAVTEPAPPLRAADGEDQGVGAETPDEPKDGAEAKTPEREPSPTELRAESNRVVDDWHQAASVADRNRYLDHFSLDAVFLGTDPEERWDLAAFTAYVDRYFAPPYKGWTFTPSDRHVIMGPDSQIAWFDEKLESEKYGTVRGTGVLRRVGDSWKISHYSMTLAVPNDAMGAVREAILETEAASR